MCRTQVRTSHLLDNCPYIGELIDVPNPWRDGDFQTVCGENSNRFMELGARYDWMGNALHLSGKKGEHKIDMTSRELGLTLSNKTPEVYIDDETEVKDFIKANYPRGYILVHTAIEFHTEHNWDASAWIKENLPELPVINTGKGGGHHRFWEDINQTFVILKYATHRVLSSSVLVHAADSLNVPVDVINYGKKDRKVWPVNDIAIKIREEGKWLT